MLNSSSPANNEKSTNLFWLDMEMSGLDYTQNVILEIAVVITDKNLNVLTQTPNFAIHQPDEVLNHMDKWNTSTHTKSGLIERIKNSTHTITEVEAIILKTIKPFIEKSQSPLCGNTIHQDRKFMVKYMPKLEGYLHYRNLDVSTIKELAKRWYPTVYNGFKKQNKHEALADVLESINELKYYRDQLFKE